MKFNLIKTSLLAGFLLFSVAANAQVKVGIVISSVIEQSPQAQALSQTLEREFSEKQAELNKLGQQIEKEQADLQKNSMAMSEDQIKAKERDISLMVRNFTRKRDDVQEMFNLRRNEELGKLQSLVQKAIQEIGKNKKFDLILYEGIAYFDPAIDVTPDVLEFLKKDFEAQKNKFNR